MKPLVIYHADCADGFGAAFAAWLKLGDDAEYVPMHYMKPGEGVEDFLDRTQLDCSVAERDVYILDFSLPKVVMDWLFAHAKRVVWLDHHKTAFEMWCGKYERGMRFAHTNGCYGDENFDIVLDDNKSGAVLAWKWFHGTEVPLFIRHIDDYDRWQFKLRGTKEIARALRSYAPWSFEQWEGLLLDEHYGSMFTEGAAILSAHNQNVQAGLKGARECGIDFKVGYSEAEGCEVRCRPIGLAANAPSFLASDLGHELAKQSGTYGLVWYVAGDLTVRCSLRSNGDYDVSAIAKAFGGGGHQNAAGFSTDLNTLKGWLA